MQRLVFHILVVQHMLPGHHLGQSRLKILRLFIFIQIKLMRQRPLKGLTGYNGGFSLLHKFDYLSQQLGILGWVI